MTTIDWTTTAALPSLDLDTVRETVAPVVQRGADRGWSLADLDWSGVRPELLTEADRSAVRFLTYIEDHLPGYLNWLLRRFPVEGAGGDAHLVAVHREYFRFFVAWSGDEERHSAALTRYQEVSGMTDGTTLLLELAAEGTKPFDKPYLEPLEVFAYTMIQEKATQLFYQRFRSVVREPLLRDLLSRLARDEVRHFSLYANLVERYLRRDATAAVPHLAEVLRTFRMPLAETLPRYRRWSEEVAATAGYDHTEAYEALERLVDRFADGPSRSAVDNLRELVRQSRTMP